MTTFPDRIRQLEEKLFGDQLHPSDGTRMKEDRYFWNFRPSHHFKSGLLTEADIQLLSEPGKRMLSVGAYPGFLERILPELGVPSKNILVTDKDPLPAECASVMKTLSFDMLDSWPSIGMFDCIIFPESLCISLTHKIAEIDPEKRLAMKEKDALEAELLTGVVRQALMRLRPRGILRANGPMSLPQIVNAMSERLQEEFPHHVTYQRYLLEIRT